MKCETAQRLTGSFVAESMDERDVQPYLEHISHCKDCENDLEITFLMNRAMEQFDRENGSYDFQKLISDYKQQQKNWAAERINVTRLVVLLCSIAGMILLAISIQQILQLWEHTSALTSLTQLFDGLR